MISISTIGVSATITDNGSPKTYLVGGDKQIGKGTIIVLQNETAATIAMTYNSSNTLLLNPCPISNISVNGTVYTTVSDLLSALDPIFFLTSGGGGGGNTDLGNTRSATAVSLTSSTGAGTTIQAATSTLSGVMTAAQASALASLVSQTPITIGPTKGQYPDFRSAYVALSAAGSNFAFLKIIENTTETGASVINWSTTLVNVAVDVADGITWDCRNFSAAGMNLPTSVPSFFYVSFGFGARHLYAPTTNFSGFINAATPANNATFFRKNYNLDLTSVQSTIVGASLFRNIGNIFSEGITNISLPNSASCGLRYANCNGVIVENAQINFTGGGANCSSVIEYANSTAIPNFNSNVSFAGQFDTANPIVSTTFNFNAGISFATSSTPINAGIMGSPPIISNNNLLNLTVLGAKTTLANVNLQGGLLNINSQSDFIGFNITAAAEPQNQNNSTFYSCNFGQGKQTTIPGSLGTDVNTLDDGNGNELISGVQILKQNPEPFHPPAGYNSLYPKSDDNMYIETSNQIEKRLLTNEDLPTPSLGSILFFDQNGKLSVGSGLLDENGNLIVESLVLSGTVNFTVDKSDPNGPVFNMYLGGPNGNNGFTFSAVDGSEYFSLRSSDLQSLYVDDRYNIDQKPRLGIGTTFGPSNRPTATLDVSGDGGDEGTIRSDYYYFGNPQLDGTWRMSNSGANLVFELLVSGVWIQKNILLSNQNNGGTVSLTADTNLNQSPQQTALISSVGINVFFPSNPIDGDILAAKNMVTGTSTLDGNGKNIDGNPTKTVSLQYESLTARYSSAIDAWVLF